MAYDVSRPQFSAHVDENIQYETLSPMPRRSKRALPPDSEPRTVFLSIRVPVAVIQQLDELAAVNSTPWLTLTRSDVARTAILAGVNALTTGKAKR